MIYLPLSLSRELENAIHLGEITTEDPAIKLHLFEKAAPVSLCPNLFCQDLPGLFEDDSIGSWKDQHYLDSFLSIKEAASYFSFPAAIAEIHHPKVFQRRSNFRQFLAFGESHYLFSSGQRNFFREITDIGIGRCVAKENIELLPAFEPDIYIKGTVFFIHGNANLSLALLSLASLLMLRNEGQHLLDESEPLTIVVFAKNFPTTVFIQKLCEGRLKGFDPHRVIDIGNLSFSCDRLLVPSFMYHDYHLKPGLLYQKLGDELHHLVSRPGFRRLFFRQYHSTIGNYNTLPRKIFVSRADASRRFIENEDAIFSTLEKAGYAKVCPGLFSLPEQAELFSQATHVIGQHGMGLANIFFSPSQAALAEIFTPYLVRNTYKMLTNSRHIDYGCFLFGPSVPPLDRGNVHIPENLFFDTLDAHGFLSDPPR